MFAEGKSVSIHFEVSAVGMGRWISLPPVRLTIYRMRGNPFPVRGRRYSLTGRTHWKMLHITSPVLKFYLPQTNWSGTVSRWFLSAGKWGFFISYGRNPPKKPVSTRWVRWGAGGK